MGRSGESRVLRNFLVFTQLAQWLRLLADVVDGGNGKPAAAR
jgi:hypothetical protein